jgi:lipopolysaccharide heptosyltransferase II
MTQILKLLLRRLILAGITALVAVGGTGAHLVRKRPAKELFASAVPARILLIRLDLLGDVVFALSAARRLKERIPGSKISMVTLPQTAALAASSPDVDEVIPIDTNLIRSPRTLFRRSTLRHLFSGLRQMRGKQFDLSVSLYGRTASLIALVSRSRLRAGLAGEAYPASLDVMSRPGRMAGRRQHDTRFQADLLDAVLGELSLNEPIARPHIAVDPAAREEVIQMLAAAGIDESHFLVVFQVAAGYGDFKRWPAANFTELARRIGSDHVWVVVAGARDDVELADGIAADSPAISVAGQTDLPQLIALMDRADLVVSGDSGPLHLASALGTPVIGIYGPTDPEANGPVSWAGQKIAILRRDLACSPCYSVRTRAECPLGDPICMRLVTVDQVAAAVGELLALDGDATP